MRLQMSFAKFILWLYEKEFPNSDSPRKAIEAAERVMNASGDGNVYEEIKKFYKACEECDSIHSD